jgi:hypothetical protein
VIFTFIEDIEEAISLSSIVVSSNIQKYFGSSNKEAYIKGKLTFIDLSSLDFSIYVLEKGKKLICDKYRFQYMDSAHRPGFRYDNAPHHKEILSFPMHKHLGDKVVASDMPEMGELLGEVSALITKSIK